MRLMLCQRNRVIHRECPNTMGMNTGLTILA